MEKAIVIGAGISGLACAFRLKELGIPCLVFESKNQAGGLIATIRRNGFLFETGPQCPRFPDSVWRLVRQLDLQDEFVAGDAKAKRYILLDRTLHPAPFSPAGLLNTPLVGLSNKLRILTEAFRHSRPPDHEETLAEFVERKFGEQVLNNLVDPLISTIFFGDAQKMGMESAFPALVEWERGHGSLVRSALRARKSKNGGKISGEAAARLAQETKGGSFRVTDSLPSLGSFRSGMGTLIEKLAAELQAEIRYKVDVTSIAPLHTAQELPKPGWQIGLASGERITAEHLILAVPPYTAACLLEQNFPQLASHLRAIEYAPFSAVFCGYERSQVTNSLDGFGFMVPRREGLHTICTFWNSSLFPGRAPEGKVLMTSFVRESAGNDALPQDDEGCATAVEAENADILGISGTPVERLVWREARALPQYNVGHAHRVAEIYRLLATIPQLHIAGNFLKGRSIGDCVDVASRVAEDVRSRV